MGNEPPPQTRKKFWKKALLPALVAALLTTLLPERWQAAFLWVIFYLVWCLRDWVR
jgi:hypothetical protein